MKKENSWSIGVVLICMMFLVASCSNKMDFQSSAVVPGATGYVKVKNDNNKNYSVKVKTYNLAAPEQLSPPRKVYVVWMKTPDNQSKDIGQIKTEAGKKGTLETISTNEPEGFFITAEDAGNPMTPGTTVVLTTK